MPDRPKDDQTFDVKRRVDELLQQFRGMPADRAREQLAVLPYYNAIENEVTQSKRGIFVTHYFLTKWAPDLGQPAANIVLALQKLSDKHTGETIASLDAIATVAAVNVATLKRWLSTNERVWEGRSDKQRRQWQLLHEYWIKEIRRRYRQHFDESGRSQTRQTTNAIRVSIDDPVHPDDFGKLHALAAERIANEEYEEWQRRNVSKSLELNGPAYEAQSALHKRRKEIIRSNPTDRIVDNSPYEAQSALHRGSADGATVSSSYRTNVTNVSEHSSVLGRGSLRTDPRVQAMSAQERESRESMAQEIGRQLNVMAGDRDFGTEDHKSLGFHRRVAFLMPRQLVYEALTAARDAIDDERAGRKTVRGVDAYFAGTVQRIAERERIDLGVEWKAKHPSEAI